MKTDYSLTYKRVFPNGDVFHGTLDGMRVHFTNNIITIDVFDSTNEAVVIFKELGIEEAKGLGLGLIKWAEIKEKAKEGKTDAS